MGNEDDSTYRSATDIASYVVRRAFAGGHSVNSSQLQLILFFAQELHIGETDRPLFADRIVAREYGPMVPSVFRKYVSYGGEPLIPSIGGDRSSSVDEDATLARWLDDIVDVYGTLDTAQLIKLSQLGGFAWDRTFNRGGRGYGDGDEITVDDMTCDMQKASGINMRTLHEKIRKAVMEGASSGAGYREAQRRERRA